MDDQLNEAIAITFLSLAQVIEIHDNQLEENGGGLPGIRDHSLLDSAVSVPRATFGGRFLHGDIFAMAGAYFLSLAKNHAFCDGNKRTAVSATTTFLQMNGIALEVDDDSLVEFTERVAGEKVTNAEIANFLKRWAYSLEVDT